MTAFAVVRGPYSNANISAGRRTLGPPLTLDDFGFYRALIPAIAGTLCHLGIYLGHRAGRRDCTTAHRVAASEG